LQNRLHKTQHRYEPNHGQHHKDAAFFIKESGLAHYDYALAQISYQSGTVLRIFALV
jgi:hypothetical protein